MVYTLMCVNPTPFDIYDQNHINNNSQAGEKGEPLRSSFQSGCKALLATVLSQTLIGDYYGWANNCQRHDLCG
jgi:hypothetical protein